MLTQQTDSWFTHTSLEQTELCRKDVENAKVIHETKANAQEQQTEVS